MKSETYNKGSHSSESKPQKKREIMSEEKKCPKCGSVDREEKHIRLAGTLGYFNPLEATVYICGKCGYIEFYRK